jgi:Uncharacterized conserved protein
MDLRYEVTIYWSGEDQAFIAEAPELPGCMADGETRQEALQQLETFDAVDPGMSTLRTPGSIAFQE